MYSPMGKGSLDAYNYVIKYYRKLSPSEINTAATRSLQGQAKITLAEFVRLVVDDSSPYNIHWDQYVNNCHPCVINYDHMIRTETNNWDAVVVLDILSRGLDKKQLKHNVLSRDKAAIKENMVNPSFTRVLKEFESVLKDDLRKLLQHFKVDLDMFGYQFDTLSLEATCSLVNHTSKAVCC